MKWTLRRYRVWANQEISFDRGSKSEFSQLKNYIVVTLDFRSKLSTMRLNMVEKLANSYQATDMQGCIFVNQTPHLRFFKCDF